MRQVGTIAKSELAERFADYLRVGGIKCTVDSAADGYRVWVHDDDRLAAAKEQLPPFLAEPDHQRYLDAAQLVKARMREELSRQIAARRQTVNLSDKWNRPTGQNFPVTFGLIGISIVVAFFRGLDPQHFDPRLDWLYFSNDNSMHLILQGEVWRLVTPIFLHFGLPHLIFNMLGTQQFGTQIESRLGSLKLFGMVLAIAVVSNFAQFWFRGPWFGGMSGVVYGLFGYIWVKGKLEPGTGFDLPQQTVIMMLAWHVLCMVGVISNVANWAHGGGLVTGVALAFGAMLLKPFVRQK